MTVKCKNPCQIAQKWMNDFGYDLDAICLECLARESLDLEEEHGTLEILDKKEVDQTPNEIEYIQSGHTDKM